MVGICCADVHLTLTPPAARSAEPDWLEAQQRPLDELRHLVEVFNAPLIIAGDIFDRWNPPVELVNWAIDHLPDCYAVPGQHDLPYHRFCDVAKTGYGTLMRAGTILGPAALEPLAVPGKNIVIHPFPWGVLPEPLDKTDDALHLAVVHTYCWAGNCRYPGAPESSHIRKFRSRLAGYDAAIFGDNHTHWSMLSARPGIWNCGALIRRKSDEAGFRPVVGLLHDDGTFSPHFLETEHDRFAAAPDVVCAGSGIDMSAMVKELRGLDDKSLDFFTAVRRWIEDNKTANGVRKLVLDALE